VKTKKFIKKSNEIGIKRKFEVVNRIYHVWAGVKKVHPIGIKIIGYRGGQGLPPAMKVQ